MEEDESSSDEIGGMFRVIGEKQSQKSTQISTMDQVTHPILSDNTSDHPLFSNQPDRTIWSWSDLHNWNDEEVRDLIKDCFVTGKWSESQVTMQ